MIESLFFKAETLPLIASKTGASNQTRLVICVLIFTVILSFLTAILTSLIWAVSLTNNSEDGSVIENESQICPATGI